MRLSCPVISFTKSTGIKLSLNEDTFRQAGIRVMHTPRYRRHEIIARFLLGGMIALILATAFSEPWHQMGSMDSRSHFEMIQGIADHGLPTMSNGPVHRYPELSGRWNLPEGSVLWGTYPPFYAYLMAPFYILGGLTSVIQVTIILLTLLLMAVYLLSLELTRKPLLSVLAAGMAVFANGMVTKGFKTDPYILASTLMTIAVYCAVKSISNKADHQQGWAFSAGLFGGLGAATHLLVFPMAAALIFTLMVIELRRGLMALIGIIIPLLSLSGLNLLRFGSPNPLSYGPCVWRVCQGPRQLQTLSHLLQFAVPVLIWIFVTGILIFVLRKRRNLPVGIFSLSIIALLLIPILRERTWLYVQAFWGILVNLGYAEMDGAYTTVKTGPGIFRGSFLLKSLLQCTPVLILAPFTQLRWRREGIVVMLPVAALIAVIILRANMSWAHIVGHSAMQIRYLLPAAPLLVVLTMTAVSEHEWRTRHLVSGVIFTALFTLWLVSGKNDLPMGRRMILIAGGPILAGITAAGISLARHRSEHLWSRFSVWCTTLAIGWGFAVSIGVDLNQTVKKNLKTIQRQEQLRSIFPEQFAVMAWPNRLNPFLAMKDSCEIQYADLSELENWKDVEGLLHHWLDTDIPVYFLLPKNRKVKNPWSHLKFQRIKGAAGIRQIRHKTKL